MIKSHEIKMYMYFCAHASESAKPIIDNQVTHKERGRRVCVCVYGLIVDCRHSRFRMHMHNMYYKIYTSSLVHNIGKECGDLPLAVSDRTGGAEALGELSSPNDTVVGVESLAWAARWEVGQELVEVGAS